MSLSFDLNARSVLRKIISMFLEAKQIDIPRRTCRVRHTVFPQCLFTSKFGLKVDIWVEDVQEVYPDEKDPPYPKIFKFLVFSIYHTVHLIFVLHVGYLSDILKLKSKQSR